MEMPQQQCVLLVLVFILLATFPCCSSFAGSRSSFLYRSPLPLASDSSSSSSSSSDGVIFTTEDVEFYAFKSGIFIKSQVTGPSLRLEAFAKDDLDYKIGYLTCFIRPFTNLLQLETIQVLNRRQTLGFKREGYTMNGPGICFIMGSWALRWAYEKGSKQAELLAVNDSEQMHRILIALYESFGFKRLKYIDEDNVKDRLVWGALGTLMSLDMEWFMENWTPKLRAFDSDIKNTVEK